MNRITIVAPLAALALSGCVSFGAKPPRELLSLTPQAQTAPGQQRSVAQDEGLIVELPDVAHKLETPRLPVQVDDTRVAYVAKAQWVDMPRRMFRDLLTETLRAGAGIAVIDPDQSSLVPHSRLGGRLIEFGVDARSNSAIVTYDAELVVPGAKAVLAQRFTATQPLGGKIDGPVAARAVNAAANKVAADVGAWVKAR